MDAQHGSQHPPALTADPPDDVRRHIGDELIDRYEVLSYRSAAAVLAGTLPERLVELREALLALRITTEMMKAPGGNESQIPKALSGILRPKGWLETELSADLLVRASAGRQTSEHLVPGYISGHKVDYVKVPVALDMEWNSKDQTFDRDLYAMRAFHDCGIISVGVILTRGVSLNNVINGLGIGAKYGASTTWMGKLAPRLDAGRNGACPVLAFGMTEKCVTDWPPQPEANVV